MSASWAPLLPVAMVGTDRQALPLAAWPGEVGQLVAQAAGSAGDAATGVLRAAAVLAACGLAGAQGAPWPDAMPAAAADEALRALPDGPLLTLVTWAFHDGPSRLQHEVCLALARAQRRLPHALLPQALELGRRSLAMRPLLLPVLGERGLWLAAQRDDWRYAAGVNAAVSEETRWTDGSFEQRREFLERERASDPPAARDRLTQSLSELPAKERAELVGVLGLQLSLDDEPLLENLRTDRSREVQRAALSLLLRLPDAAHPRRAVDRLKPLLKNERVLLRKRWLIDAPAAVGEDWKADNIDPVRPKHESLGERGWWLYQLVRQVPLGWWTQHTGMDAAELHHWAGSTDWGEALLRGWRDALFAAPEIAWCEAFLDKWPKAALHDDQASVLAMLPLAARERHWQRQLRDSHVAFYTLVPQMLAACPAGETLSSQLSAALADTLYKRVEARSLSDDYSLRALVPDLCCVLHIDVLDRMAQLPRHAEETPSYADILHAVAQVIHVRKALHTLTTSNTP
jgi:hypothetical protein